MKTIYVAGASCDFEQVSEAIKALREGGWTITFDWTEAVRAAFAAGTPDSTLTDVQACRLAEADAAGVAEAAWFWFRTPSRGKSEGAHFELGLAHGLGKRILISGERTCIFQALYPRHTHDQALRHLLAYGQGR